MFALELAGGDFEQEMIPAFLERQALELVARAVIGRLLAGRWYFAAVEEQPAFLGGVTERGELRRVGAVRQQVVERARAAQPATEIDRKRARLRAGLA